MKYREILEQNRTFILERPVHTVTTFIYFEKCTNFENFFTQEFSDTLDRIRELTNLVFIFNKNQKGKINFKNLSTLYRACGYVVSDHDYPTQSVYYALSYFKILYERHTGYLIMSNFELNESKDYLDKYSSIIYNGALTSSIYKKERVSIGDLSKIFFTEDKKLSFWDRLKGKVELKYTSGMYSRFDTTLKTFCIYLRSDYVGEMRNFLESPECPKYFLESFYTRYPNEFIASIGEFLPGNIKILDLEIQNIDLR
jgi:hypothetical protein